MLKKACVTAWVFLALASSGLAAEFGDLAGSYSGKTLKGGDVLIVIPKSGTPTYRFRGAPVLVSSPKLAGKSISFNVGNGGMGKVTLVPAGKGQMSYSYKDSQGGTASATLTKG